VGVAGVPAEFSLHHGVRIYILAVFSDRVIESLVTVMVNWVPIRRVPQKRRSSIVLVLFRTSPGR
jgi:hypothetical protein